MIVDDEVQIRWHKEILARLDKIDRHLASRNNVNSVLDGDTLLENHDLCRLLGVTKRTIQRYKKRNLIPFYTLTDGKTYYKASEVREFLNRRLRRKGKQSDDQAGIV
jgi:endonuclease YncB( thermonuclease family)